MIAKAAAVLFSHLPSISSTGDEEKGTDIARANLRLSATKYPYSTPKPNEELSGCLADVEYDPSDNVVFCVPKSALTVPAINISPLVCAKDAMLKSITDIIK